jgi:hypothetical protein
MFDCRFHKKAGLTGLCCFIWAGNPENRGQIFNLDLSFIQAAFDANIFLLTETFSWVTLCCQLDGQRCPHVWQSKPDREQGFIAQPAIKITYGRMAHKMLTEKHTIQERKRSYEEIPVVDDYCGLDID